MAVLIEIKMRNHKSIWLNFSIRLGSRIYTKVKHSGDYAAYHLDKHNH